MVRNFIALFLVAFVAGQIHGAVVRPKGQQPPLKFIGEYKKPMNILDTTQEGPAIQQTSFYFLSQNAAGYATAEADCQAQLGSDATLLYIETEDELKEVKSFLASSDDTGSTYWVGGKYDPDSRKLVWGNGVEIGSFAPWDSGHPNSQVPVTRVSAYTAGSLKLRTQFQTVSNRYICELQVGARHNAQFKFLGQYKSPQTMIGINGVSTRQTSFYFLSQNAAGFQTAESDCKAFLGDDATLLYIETQEELGNVTEFLSSSDDTGSTYWVGGRYDTDKQTFVWGSGAELGNWAPWDAGMPNTRTQLTRVFAYTVGSLKLRTQFNTVSTRYICELGAGLPEEEPIPCYNDNDLVIVVDSSGSIGQANYTVALDFAAKLAVAWADNPRNRLSVIVFSNSVRTIFSLSDTLTITEIRDQVYGAPYLNGQTYSDLGLDRAVEEFSSSPRSVPLNIVFVTDGESTVPQNTVEAAQRVKDAGIRAFSVGIGSSIDPAELLTIAGGRQDYVFNTDGFADLLKLLQPVSVKVCE